MTTMAQGSKKKARRTSEPTLLRPTLGSVAKVAGCSVSTVSAVLASRPGSWASPETRQRVIDAAQTLGYRPNVAARSLRGGATQTLGLLTTALDVEVTAAKVAA